MEHAHATDAKIELRFATSKARDRWLNQYAADRTCTDTPGLFLANVTCTLQVWLDTITIRVEREALP